jgi:hypothetical protein
MDPEARARRHVEAGPFLGDDGVEAVVVDAGAAVGPGMSKPKKPCLPASFQMSRGIDLSSIISSARGRMTRSMNSRAEARSAW